MPAITSLLSEAELHGLVDGHIEADRRADILRRAAVSTVDQDRIEAWQEQADSIRAAFRGLDKEPLPSALDIRSPASLLCLPLVQTVSQNNETVATSHDPAPMTVALERPKWRQFVLACVTVAVTGCGLGGAWMIAGSERASSVSNQATVDDLLASRAAAVLASPPSTSIPPKPVAMPTSSIPDLTSVGFTLSDAEAQSSEPVSLVFRYRNAAAEQIVIGVARAPRDWQRDLPGANRNVVVWRVGAKAYAIAGTLRPERLRAIAASLRDEAIEE